MHKAKTTCQPFSLGRTGFSRLSYPLRNSEISSARTELSVVRVHWRMATKLKPGDPAPDFSGVATDGAPLALAQYRGRKLVLYFYPRDDTPGCTRQACSLRDHAGEIAAKGAAVLGVSTQDPASHGAFTRKYRLNFPLLADTGGEVGRAYGVLGGPGLLAKLRSAAGLAQRVTFVIDADGRIAHVIERPDVARHAEEVLALL